MADGSEESRFYVEISPVARTIQLEGAGDNLQKLSRDALSQVGRLVREACMDLVEEVESLPRKPAQLQIEFGVNVGAEGGLPFISKGSIGANFKVAMTWSWT